MSCTTNLRKCYIKLVQSKNHPPNSEQANGSETKTQISIFVKKNHERKKENA